MKTDVSKLELLCPAGSFPAAKAAVDNGADAVYLGYQDETNARHFKGLNFSLQKLEAAVEYAHQRNRKVHLAINTYASAKNWQQWQRAVDYAAELKVDALIVADIAVLEYAAIQYPNLELHLSVQASITNSAAINFFQTHFNIKRVVLPRVLSIHQVKQLARSTDIDLEVFAFGSLCIMAEGRCYLSSYMTGESPNSQGVCSPAKHVTWKESPTGLESRLNDFLIDRYGENENAGYPTLCKGRFDVGGETYHALEEPVSLNTLELLPELYSAGVTSVKIEGRQRSPAYIAQVTKTWRAAIDDLTRDSSFDIKLDWQRALAAVSEGAQTSLGAYHKKWK